MIMRAIAGRISFEVIHTELRVIELRYENLEQCTTPDTKKH